MLHMHTWFYGPIENLGAIYGRKLWYLSWDWLRTLKMMIFRHIHLPPNNLIVLYGWKKFLFFSLCIPHFLCLLFYCWMYRLAILTWSPLYEHTEVLYLGHAQLFLVLNLHTDFQHPLFPASLPPFLVCFLDGWHSDEWTQISVWF